MQRLWFYYIHGQVCFYVEDSFIRREDADRAIAELNGYALNHLILSLGYSEKKKTSAPRYATGYGRALPQNVRR